jgi:PadR family transcriptional regulator, regulatory protein PadR
MAGILVSGKRSEKGLGSDEREMRMSEGAPLPMGNHTIDVRPKKWLSPVVLLALREKSSHGYELMDRIARFGFEAINPGTLYRALRRMEEEGLCESEWETSKGGGAACRIYSVTDAGVAYLDSWAEECKKSNGFWTLST